MFKDTVLTNDSQIKPDNYNEVKLKFETHQCWGLLTSIDLQQCNPEVIRSASLIEDYVIRLCDLIEMKRFEEPQIVHFGQEEKVAGYSLVQLIETSLVSGHFVNLTNAAYIDIFSCKLYNPYQAAEFTKEFFHAGSVHMSLNYRK